MIEFMGEVVSGIILLIVSGVGAYALNYLRMKKCEILSNSKDIETLGCEIMTLKRVLIMVAKRLDKGSKKYHQDLDSAYEDLVKDLLTDEILGGSKTAI